MTEPELRVYALRGLAARLTELDDERARILVLLEQWGAAARPVVRRQVRSIAPRTEFAVTTATNVADRPDSDALAPAVELEVARVLPRRNRAQARPPVVETAPALPPMPRLVKARAS
jgi:hypothetical protein